MVIVGAAGAGFSVAPSHHRHVDRIGGLAVDEWVAHQRAAELLRVHSAFAQSGVDAAVPPLVLGNEAEMRQAIHRSAAAGGIHHLEKSIAALTEAPIQGGTERSQLAQLHGAAHG
jgi:hypothetical protein